MAWSGVSWGGGRDQYRMRVAVVSISRSAEANVQKMEVDGREEGRWKSRDGIVVWCTEMVLAFFVDYA